MKTTENVTKIKNNIIKYNNKYAKKDKNYFVIISQKKQISRYEYLYDAILSINSNPSKAELLKYIELSRKFDPASIDDFKTKLTNTKPMATKKQPTAAQLKARANFTKMVKERAAAKKKGLKAPAKTKKRISAKTLCRKVIKVPGISVRTGQLLKGWHYVNGKPTKTKVTAKKKVVAKKKPTKRKKFLGIF